MKEPFWLPQEAVFAMHEELLARFGGISGIQDEGLLDSALNRPAQRFHYQETNLFELAASYSTGIIKNHPFLDGNKRTGFLAAYTFLGINGYTLNASEEHAVLETLALAAGESNEANYAAWLERSSSPA